MIPRSPTLKTAYRSAKHQRPKLKIHGVWCFGYVLRLVVLEEDTFHGSSLVHELLALTIEDIMEVCSTTGISAPDTLVIVGDNTVKEMKNRVILGGLANLINHGRFRFLSLISNMFVISSMLVTLWCSGVVSNLVATWVRGIQQR